MQLAPLPAASLHMLQFIYYNIVDGWNSLGEKPVIVSQCSWMVLKVCCWNNFYNQAPIQIIVVFFCLKIVVTECNFGFRTARPFTDCQYIINITPMFSDNSLWLNLGWSHITHYTIYVSLSYLVWWKLKIFRTFLNAKMLNILTFY